MKAILNNLSPLSSPLFTICFFISPYTYLFSSSIPALCPSSSLLFVSFLHHFPDSSSPHYFFFPHPPQRFPLLLSFSLLTFITLLCLPTFFSSFLAVRFLLSLLFFTLFPHLSLYISLSLSSLPLLPSLYILLLSLPTLYSIHFFLLLSNFPSIFLTIYSFYISLSFFSSPTLLLIFVLSFG